LAAYKTAYNVCGLACILGLTSSTRQVFLTSEARSNDVVPDWNGVPPLGKALPQWTKRPYQ